jgi:hypothetical protein
VLAVDGSKRVHNATHGESGEAVTVGPACGSGSNWIPAMILYKGKYRREESGVGLPAGNTSV